jgi:phosphate:Na+ symporter
LEFLLSIIAGLVLFLYAINHLSEVIHEVVGERVKFWLQKFTSNNFSALLTGLVATTILDSSSAVIIISVVFVNNGILNFRKGMGVVLGANIGTTVSSQIIALDIGKFSPVLLLIGFLLVFISRSQSISNTGKAILYFGVLFFGLFTIERAVEPLKNDPIVLELLQKTNNPGTGVLTGILTTLIIQSSSATVGMAIILAKKGILSLGGSIAIMMGAEFGTCSDTILATIKGSRQAIKTVLFHVVFNILSIICGIILFIPFVSLVETVSQSLPIERKVANAHMLFNVIGALVFIWFIPFFEKLFNRLIPEKAPVLSIESSQVVNVG